MGKPQQNLIVYLSMLIVFGVFIYFAIIGGESFQSESAAITHESANAFDMFLMVIKDNLHHPFSILLFQIIVVLIAVRLFAWIFRHIGQPGVIGEIVAGIVLGPSVCGALFPQFFGFLFQPSSLKNLELISQIGLVLFMFVIGMEVDFKVLKNKINQTLVISHAGILVPFLLGVLSSYLIYEEYASSQVAFLPFALFIGISMSITAFPVLARIIQERNMTKEPVGILTIASAANDDVTAWCLLAVVIAITKAGTFGGALYTVLLTLLYILIMFLLVRPFLKRIGDVYSNKEVINKAFVSFILLVLIISSTITEILGIHALFGAFIAGVVMPSNFGFRKVMMDKVEDIALVFFLPLFFAFTGLRTQIGLVNSPEMWMLCLMLILVAVTGKIGGCAIAARVVGEKWKDSFVIGTLMNTRGLMELVALNIGYELGVLPPSIFVLLVIMALVTTFMTTPLLDLVEWSFKTHNIYSRKKLILFFGRPKSGARLLSVYSIIFGSKIKDNQVLAIHYTQGSDLNATSAEEFSKESFLPIESYARHIHINVENFYRITDNLVNDIVQTVEVERPTMILLGAGPNFMNNSDKNFVTFFNLFRNKTDQILSKVNCTIGVFINHVHNEGTFPAILINGEQDSFFFLFISRLLSASDKKIFVYYTPGNNEKYNNRISKFHFYNNDRINAVQISRTDAVSINKEVGLLMISEATCELLSEESPELFSSFPPILMIKPGKEN